MTVKVQGVVYLVAARYCFRKRNYQRGYSEGGKLEKSVGAAAAKRKVAKRQPVRHVGSKFFLVVARAFKPVGVAFPDKVNYVESFGKRVD